MNKSIDLMERMGLMEKSRSEKNKDVKRIENFFKKGNNKLIKCFCILTAENPDSVQIDDKKVNRSRNQELYNILKTQYTIIPVQGRWGDDGKGNPIREHSYIVLNCPKGVASSYCGKYQQTSFLYCYFDENGELSTDYCEKRNPNKDYDKNLNPYEVKETNHQWVDKTNENDFCTIVGQNFKFAIPFKLFEDYANAVDKLMVENNVTDKEKMVKMLIEGVGYGAFYNRAKYRVKELM